MNAHTALSSGLKLTGVFYIYSKPVKMQIPDFKRI
jgi:hypothetical protein